MCTLTHSCLGGEGWKTPPSQLVTLSQARPRLDWRTVVLVWLPVSQNAVCVFPFTSYWCAEPTSVPPSSISSSSSPWSIFFLPPLHFVSWRSSEERRGTRPTLIMSLVYFFSLSLFLLLDFGLLNKTACVTHQTEVLWLGSKQLEKEINGRC